FGSFLLSARLSASCVGQIEKESQSGDPRRTPGQPSTCEPRATSARCRAAQGGVPRCTLLLEVRRKGTRRAVSRRCIDRRGLVECTARQGPLILVTEGR